MEWNPGFYSYLRAYVPVVLVGPESKQGVLLWRARG